jgi:hypothetical protein
VLVGLGGGGRVCSENASEEFVAKSICISIFPSLSGNKNPFEGLCVK